MNADEPIKRATRKDHNYENFIAYCPYCEYRNIFNRRDDLHELDPISHKYVTCLNAECQKTFSIAGDLGDSVYDYLLFDCDHLLNEKRYMFCILNITQAYEVFFSTYLRVELLYKPCAQEEKQNPYTDSLEHLNRVAQKLYHQISDYTYANLRRIFLRRVVQGSPVMSFDEAEEAIRLIPKQKGDLSNVRIQQCTQEPLTTLLQRLNRCKVAEFRNQVLHQRAYRPSCNDVKPFLDEAHEIIGQLEDMLNVHDDINWYAGIG